MTRKKAIEIEIVHRGKMSHTKEPWDSGFSETGGIEIVHNYTDKWGEHRKIIAMTIGERKTDRANAARIIACVNACAGLPEPEKNIEWLVKAVKVYFDAQRRIEA